MNSLHTKYIGDEHHIDLLTFIPKHLRDAFIAGTKQTTIKRTPQAFQSDGWSAATVEGVLKQRDAMEEADVAEVGVGAGTVSLIASALNRPRELHVSDYLEEHTLLTRNNALSVLNPDDNSRIHYHEGSVNLLKWNDGSKKLRVVMACIPQVVKENGGPRDADYEANYFNAHTLEELGVTRKFSGIDRRQGLTRELFHATIEPSDLDLDLNVALLRQVRELDALTPDGYVSLTLGGRPTEDVLRAVIQKEGYAAEVAHRQVVQQDPHTNIESLVAHEQQLRQAYADFRLAFFQDTEASKPVGADHAAELLRDKQPVYHEVLVMKCTPDKK